MSNNKIRGILVRPLSHPISFETDDSLSSLQKLVDGYIEAIYPFDDHAAIICNEEAKLRDDLLPNRALYDENGRVYDIIFGDFFICLARPDSENFESLSDDLIKKYIDYYKKPEIFMIVNGEIKVIK